MLKIYHKNIVNEQSPTWDTRLSASSVYSVTLNARTDYPGYLFSSSMCPYSEPLIVGVHFRR